MHESKGLCDSHLEKFWKGHNHNYTKYKKIVLLFSRNKQREDISISNSLIIHEQISE